MKLESGYELRDELAKKEGSPYHETSEARVLAFTNGWNSCLQNEGCGKLVKRFGEVVNERQKLLDSLEAIKARITGEWDNKCLMAIGELSVNTEEDILEIINHYQ